MAFAAWSTPSRPDPNFRLLCLLPLSQRPSWILWLDHEHDYRRNLGMPQEYLISAFPLDF